MSATSSITRVDQSARQPGTDKADLPARPPLLHGVYGPYVLLPLLSACVWLAGLLALIGVWAASGTPRYGTDSANIVFISNVGAYHQTLFICICVVTSFFYIASLLAERYLRHVDRIPAHGQRNRRVVFYDVLAIVFCILGSTALILLSAFNCYSYPIVHWCCTGVFIVCIAISALFQTLEIIALKRDHPDRSHLLRNAVLKLMIVILAIAMAVTFGVLYAFGKKYPIGSDDPATSSKGNRLTSVAAVFEWAIALVFDAYLFSLVLDLWPASKTSPRYLRRLAKWEGRVLDKVGAHPGEMRTVLPPTGRERNGRFEGVDQAHTDGGSAAEMANAGYPSDTNGPYHPATGQYAAPPAGQYAAPATGQYTAPATTASHPLRQ